MGTPAMCRVNSDLLRWMVAATGPLEMTGGLRAELERLARSHTVPAREVRQAKALLWATDGVSNTEIARRLRVHAEVCPSVA
jgi:hypothetical protein